MILMTEKMGKKKEEEWEDKIIKGSVGRKQVAEEGVIKRGKRRMR